MTAVHKAAEHKPAKAMPYMDEPWFKLLLAACEREDQRTVAQRMGVSDSVVSQVLRGTGAYGKGTASPARVAERVLHKFGSYPCPHLSEMYGEERSISAAECRAVAHRPTPPVGSPGQMLHWRACATCPHKALSAPPQPKTPKPRKPRDGAAAPGDAMAPQPQPVTATEETTL